MDHINSICSQEGYPIVVENSPTLGNHAKASRDIPQGEGLLRALPYAAEVFDNYKKRMCHVCLLYHNRSAFTYRCQDCDQVYYCSTVCKAIAMDPLLGAHSKICKTLRKLATWNSDRHTKSIIKLLLQVLMNHWRERQGIPTVYQNRKLFQETKSDDDEGLGREGSALANDLENKLSVNEQTQPASTEIQPKDIQKIEAEMQVDAATNTEIQNRNRVQEPVENDFYDFLRLQSHFEDWDEEDTKDWNKQSYIVLSFLEMAGLTEMATERGGPLKTITSMDVKKLISALESNAFGMFDRSRKKPVCFGRAIYPIASFFNHSCECNSTAVQADGSTLELTGEDVLGFLDAEEANSQKNQEGSSNQPTTPSKPTTSTSVSISSSVSSLSEQTSGARDGIDVHLDSKAGDEPSDAKEGLDIVVEDPYDSRVGQFRMMTFFSIQDITKGQDVTISYIDSEMPLHARRLALLSDYHFHCCCDRCLREEKSASSLSKKASKSANDSGKGKKGGSKSDKKSKKKSK
ncbi:hypothetical protein BGX27_006324 [Mortierella sp. AM989]|nr:hypothetical protein BGX27_006324 [Mortierella sp. AM989]